MSWTARRRSKSIEALIFSMIASGQLANRPPHRVLADVPGAPGVGGEVGRSDIGPRVFVADGKEMVKRGVWVFAGLLAVAALGTFWRGFGMFTSPRGVVVARCGFQAGARPRAGPDIH